ncbi:hypothetical protein HK096_005325, partial [Nowakowskiella sp. JEL0078]
MLSKNSNTSFLLLFLSLSLTLVFASNTAESSEVICTHSSSPGSVEIQDCYPKVFIPTLEFQIIRQNQQIPPGLHVRMNMETGVKEAKLRNPSEDDDEFGLIDVPVDETTEELKVKNNVNNQKQSIPKSRLTAQQRDAFGDLVAKLNSKSSVEEISNVLELIEEVVHEVDYGYEFIKSPKAVPAVIELLSHSSAKIRLLAATVFGSSFSNNPSVSNLAISNHDIYKVLLSHLEIENDLKALNRILYAVSSLVRSSPSISQNMRKDSKEMKPLYDLFLRLEAMKSSDRKLVNQIKDKLWTLIEDVFNLDMVSELTYDDDFKNAVKFQNNDGSVIPEDFGGFGWKSWCDIFDSLKSSEISEEADKAKEKMNRQICSSGRSFSSDDSSDDTIPVHVLDTSHSDKSSITSRFTGDKKRGGNIVIPTPDDSQDIRKSLRSYSQSSARRNLFQTPENTSRKTKSKSQKLCPNASILIRKVQFSRDLLVRIIRFVWNLSTRDKSSTKNILVDFHSFFLVSREWYTATGTVYWSSINIQFSTFERFCLFIQLLNDSQKSLQNSPKSSNAVLQASQRIKENNLSFFVRKIIVNCESDWPKSATQIIAMLATSCPNLSRLELNGFTEFNSKAFSWLGLWCPKLSALGVVGKNAPYGHHNRGMEHDYLSINHYDLVDSEEMNENKLDSSDYLANTIFQSYIMKVNSIYQTPEDVTRGQTALFSRISSFRLALVRWNNQKGPLHNLSNLKYLDLSRPFATVDDNDQDMQGLIKGLSQSPNLRGLWLSTSGITTPLTISHNSTQDHPTSLFEAIRELCPELRDLAIRPRKEVINDGMLSKILGNGKLGANLVRLAVQTEMLGCEGLQALAVYGTGLKHLLLDASYDSEIQAFSLVKEIVDREALCSNLMTTRSTSLVIGRTKLVRHRRKALENRGQREDIYSGSFVSDFIQFLTERGAQIESLVMLNFQNALNQTSMTLISQNLTNLKRLDIRGSNLSREIAIFGQSNISKSKAILARDVNGTPILIIERDEDEIEENSLSEQKTDLRTTNRKEKNIKSTQMMKKTRQYHQKSCWHLLASNCPFLTTITAIESVTLWSMTHENVGWKHAKARTIEQKICKWIFDAS